MKIQRRLAVTRESDSIGYHYAMMSFNSINMNQFVTSREMQNIIKNYE